MPGCVTITRREISPEQDYTVRGDEGAWIRQQDRIIVRQGNQAVCGSGEGIRV